LTSLLGFNYPTWGIAVTVNYPVGQSAARADAARAKLQIGQVETELHRIEVGVVTDVTNAAVNVRNNVDNVQTAITARELAEQQLDAEQKRFAAGISTNFQVVQAQKDLTDARNAELQAQVSYRKSLVEFDRVQQTTLQAAGVTLVSPSIGLPAVGSGRAASAAPSGAFIQ
jgi:outer membrane protein TolC